MPLGSASRPNMALWPVTLALGLAFSVLLTLTPGIMSTGLTLVQFLIGPLPGGGPE
jgi:hypothetical protein